MIETLLSFDTSVVQGLSAARDESLTQLCIWLTTLGGESATVLIALLVSYALWRRGGTAYVAGLFVSLGGAVAIGYIAKHVIARVRPDALNAIIETGYSFPSLHATAAMALYGFSIYAVWRLMPSGPVRNALVALCALLIFGIGFSRIYLGVHYPSDVLAGFLLGGFFVWVGILAVRKFARA